MDSAHFSGCLGCWGMSTHWDVYPGGLQRGSAQEGVSTQGVGVCPELNTPQTQRPITPIACWDTPSPMNRITELHTGLKTLPSHNFICKEFCQRGDVLADSPRPCTGNAGRYRQQAGMHSCFNQIPFFQQHVLVTAVDMPHLDVIAKAFADGLPFTIAAMITFHNAMPVCCHLNFLVIKWS